MKKAKITKEQVQYVARLANLELDSEEIEKFQSQLVQVLEYFEGISQVGTRKVKPTSQITGLESVFKKDKTRPSLSQEEVLSASNKQHKGFFKIEAIFDET